MREQKISQLRQVKRTAVDLKFFQGWCKEVDHRLLVVDYKCTKCGILFVPEGVPPEEQQSTERDLRLVYIQQRGLAGRTCLGSGRR